MGLLKLEVEPHPSGEESGKQRLDRNFNELLQELRVTQTGVQILLAFVLTMAFTTRFASLGHSERVLYGAAVVLATSAMGLLLGPVALHRLLFRQQMKDAVVRLTHIYLATGLIVLYLAVSAAVLLALWVALGPGTGVVLTVASAALVGAVWFVTPLLMRSRGSEGMTASSEGHTSEERERSHEKETTWPTT